MVKFDFYKQFILNGNESNRSLRHNFFPVNKEEINKAEDRLGFSLPQELIEFYLQIGYGFMFTNEENALNRLLHPSTVADIYLRKDEFEADPDLEIYDDKSKIIIFQVNEGIYITIDNSKDSSGVYYFTAKIAESFEDFIIKLENNSSYFEDYEI